MTERAVPAPIGYLALIRAYRDFRFLWLGQIVSNLGDWFNLIASASLITTFTESGLAVGGLFMIRTLAPFLASPIGGVIADRYNRRNVILITNFLRAPVVLAFLWVRDAGDIWLLYGLTALQLFISGIFFPARTALLPDIVPKHGIGTANVITGATFSAMLAIGSALGGFVSGSIGIYPAFVINGLTYLIAAIFLVQIRFHRPSSPNEDLRTLKQVLREYLDGLRYMNHHRYLLVIAPHKAFIGLLLGSTFEVVQVAIAEKVFTIGESGGISLGLMFAFTGVGLALGPLLIRQVIKDRIPQLVWAITLGYLIGSLGLALTAPLLSFGSALIGTFLRGIGNGVVWMFSTQLVLQLVPTHVRGRVVATEFAFSMLVSAAGAAIVGSGLDSPLGISGVAWIMAGLTLLPAILWSLWLIAGGSNKLLRQNAVV